MGEPLPYKVSYHIFDSIVFIVESISAVCISDIIYEFVYGFE